MKTPVVKPIVFKSIPELMRRMGMPEPRHSLAALVNYDIARVSREYAGRSFLIDFYKISFKRNFRGQVKYGQSYYDFEGGGMAFLAPNQLVTMPGEESSYEGYTLYFHADLIRNYQLGKNIDEYGFFSYAADEALFLSDLEKKLVAELFDNIAAELKNKDRFSQDILISQIELLLNYSNRFYHRQFITGKVLNHHLITKMNQYLANRFQTPATGLPTVQEVAGHLKVSPRYLTDILKSLTGRSTLQHIHERLIERAKAILSSTRLSSAEIAYQLGFEHPQSFNKLFKQITRQTPTAFRKSFD